MRERKEIGKSREGALERKNIREREYQRRIGRVRQESVAQA